MSSLIRIAVIDETTKNIKQKKLNEDYRLDSTFLFKIFMKLPCKDYLALIVSLEWFQNIFNGLLRCPHASLLFLHL